jgi:hypothetical protein
MRELSKKLEVLGKCPLRHHITGNMKFAHFWTLILCPQASDWVGIPLLLKPLAVIIDCIEKYCLQEPEMLGSCGVKTMQSFEPIEKCLPSVHELRPNFDPQMFNLGVPC